MDEERINQLKQLIHEEENQEALNELIQYYDEKKDFTELVHLYQLVLKNNENDIKSLNNLAVIYTDFYKDYEKAKSYYERSLKVDEKNAYIHNNYASLLENHFHQYEQAKAHYIKAIELNPKYVDAYLNLSWLYLDHLIDINTSYIVVNEALKYVDDSDIYTQIAYIEMSQYKEYDKAEENLQKAIALDNENDLAYTYYGQLYMMQKKYDDAAQWFEKALQLNQINELLVYEYGKLLVMKYKDFKGAIRILERAIEFYPENVIYYGYLANLYFVLGKINDAKKYLRKAEEFEITNQEALLMIGYLKVMLDDNKDEALMYFEKVIELNPTNLNALSFIGFYNLMNNQHIDTALTYFKKIAELSEDYFIIHFIIAQIYLQYYHDSTQALEYLLKINPKSLNPKELAHLYFVIGSIYENHVKNNNLALDYYEQAYQIKPDTYLEKVINNLYEKDKTIIN